MVTKNYLKKSKGQKDVSLISKFCDQSVFSTGPKKINYYIHKIKYYIHNQQVTKIF